jgi:glycine oxidase
MATPDLTVHGAGIFGLSIAWAATLRGANVRVIEKRGIGAGSSGGLVGALAPHVPEQWNSKKAFQLDSLLMAEGWWQKVEAAGSLSSGYGRTGRLQPLADEAALALAQARALSASSLWQDHAVWEVIAATGAAWEPQSPSGWLIRDSLTARLHPQQALRALARAIEAKGGEILTGESEAIGPQIWATGYDGLLALSEGRNRSVGGGVKGQAATLRFHASDKPQLFVEGLHIVPHADGTVAIGSTSERDWDSAEATDAQLDQLIAKARQAIPALAAAPVVGRWAGIRPRARSRAPMLGAWPGRQGHFIANGGFKIGFGMAPKIADLMADLVLNGVDAIPAAFRVEASL